MAQAFSLALSDATGRSADAWERAARAVHERYRRRFPQAVRAVPWEELDEFYRESNRRQLSSILDGMVALGAQRFHLKVSTGDLSHEKIMRSIELYGTKVVPLVREMVADAGR